MNFLQFNVTLKWSHYRPQTLKQNQTSPFNSECDIILRGQNLPFTLFLYLLTFGRFGRCCRGLHIEGANFKLDPRIATLSNTHPNFFYLNWNCEEERFQKRKFTYFIQNKTGSFFCRDRCCKMSEQMFREHARAFWRRHNSSFNGPQEMSFSIILPFLILLSLAGIKV